VVSLSPAEHQSAIRDRSEKEATHRLGLSHSTVKHHLANARSKVGAETTAQLVWIPGPRLPEPEAGADTEEVRSP
jgi:DNA-binding CsgD family transcriptional regulator